MVSRRPPRSQKILVRLAIGLVVLLIGIWLGGHPGWLPSGVRSTFEDNSNGQFVNQVLNQLSKDYYRPVDRSQLVNKGLAAAIASRPLMATGQFTAHWLQSWLLSWLMMLPVVIFAAPAIRAEIGFALHERAGPFHDFRQPQHQVLRRDRLGDEFGDAGIARRFHPVAFGMAADHDDGHGGIVSALQPAHLAGEFQPIHRLHRHVREDQVATLGALHFQRMLAMDGFIYLLHAQRIEQRPEQGAHMLLVLDHQDLDAVQASGDGVFGGFSQHDTVSRIRNLQVPA